MLEMMVLVVEVVEVVETLEEKEEESESEEESEEESDCAAKRCRIMRTWTAGEVVQQQQQQSSIQLDVVIHVVVSVASTCQAFPAFFEPIVAMSVQHVMMESTEVLV